MKLIWFYYCYCKLYLVNNGVWVIKVLECKTHWKQKKPISCWSNYRWLVRFPCFPIVLKEHVLEIHHVEGTEVQGGDADQIQVQTSEEQQVFLCCVTGVLSGPDDDANLLVHLPIGVHGLTWIHFWLFSLFFLEVYFDMIHVVSRTSQAVYSGQETYNFYTQASFTMFYYWDRQ